MISEGEAAGRKKKKYNPTARPIVRLKHVQEKTFANERDRSEGDTVSEQA